eukprot:5218673-Prymnesium_polylepis.1
MMNPIGVVDAADCGGSDVFVWTTASKPARALTKERKTINIIFQALLFRARIMFSVSCNQYGINRMHRWHTTRYIRYEPYRISVLLLAISYRIKYGNE